MSDGIPKDHPLHPDGALANAVRTSVNIWCAEMETRWEAKAYGDPYVVKRADGVRVVKVTDWGGMCPYQCQGELSDGRFFYGRLRWGTFTLCIGDTPGDAIGTEEHEGLCLWMEDMDQPEGAMLNKEFRFVTTLHLGWDWAGLDFGIEPAPEVAP